MPFWSGDTLKAKLQNIISYEDGSKGKENQIDCAAYTLKAGPEVYLTPKDNPGPKGNTKIKLENDEQFIIPPGQFVFVLTEEFVHIPSNVLAFISCKATYKFQGLVNVSGFHVDPGYSGRLVFSLYNAGPKEIALSRGADLFLIWFANLDSDASNNFIRHKEPYSSISDKLVTGISGEIFSPINVNRRLNEFRAEIQSSESRIKDWLYSRVLWVAALTLLAFAIGHFKGLEKGELVLNENQIQILKNELKQELELPIKGKS